MKEKKIIQLWFDMWIKQQDLGIDVILQKMLSMRKTVVLNMKIVKSVKLWFNEWNTRGRSCYGHYVHDDSSGTYWLGFARSRCNLGARDFSEHNHQVSQARCAIEMRTGKRGEKRLQPGRHYCRVAF